MSQKLLFLLAGLALGAAAVLGVTAVTAADPAKGDDTDVARLKAKIADLESEKARVTTDLETLRLTRNEEMRVAGDELTALRAKVETLETSAAAAAPAATPTAVKAVDPDHVPTEAEIKAAIEGFGPALQALILGSGNDDAVVKLREMFARMDPADYEKVTTEFATTPNMQKKLLLAHVLAQSGRPEAIELLGGIARDQSKGFYDRRFAAHGLAFTDDPAAPAILLEVARNDPDRGTRANASFGLARNGSDEGVRIYAAATDEAFAENDPVAMNYLSGFALLGEKALPVVRERLESYKEPQTRLVLIELVRGQKDRESLGALQRLAGDPSGDQSVREAAEKAIKYIQKQGE